jgi:hypothetical protein
MTHLTTTSPENQQVSEDDFYTQVPNTLRRDKRLDGNAKILGGMIASLAKKEGYCWMTNKAFAAEFSVSESTILRWIQQLEKCGYIHLRYKVNTRRGTDREIYMKDYPALVRTSTPEVISEAIHRAAAIPDKNNRGHSASRATVGGVKSATPRVSNLNGEGCQPCYPPGVKSATQLDTVLESGKEKIKENLSSPLPPKHGGTPPAAAAHFPEGKSSFSFPEQKETVSEALPKPKTLSDFRREWDAMKGEDQENWRPVALRELKATGVSGPREDMVSGIMFSVFRKAKKEAGE